MEDRRVYKSFSAGDGSILSVTSINHLLCTQSKRGLISLWDYEQTTVHPVLEIQIELHSFCKCVITRKKTAQYPDSCVTVAAPAAGGSDVGLWDTRCNEFRAHFRPFKSSETKSSTAGMCTALSAPDDHHLFGAYEDGSIRLWDVRHSSPLTATKLHIQPIFALSACLLPSRCSNQGQRFLCVSGGADSFIVHSAVGMSGTAHGDDDAGSGGDLAETGRTALGGSGARGVNSLCVRDDGKIAAAACWDGRVRLYANRRPRLLASLRCHSKAAQCVAFAPAGRLLASASEDPRIAIWDVYSEPRGPAAELAAGPAPSKTT